MVTFPAPQHGIATSFSMAASDGLNGYPLTLLYIESTKPLDEAWAEWKAFYLAKGAVHDDSSRTSSFASGGQVRLVANGPRSTAAK